MKKTLLDMVQSILSSMDSDEINSITDTPEALQVAGFLRDSYYEIISGLNLPTTYTLFSLNASLDNTKPTLTYLPANCINVQWIKYDKALLNQPTNIQTIDFMALEDFLQEMYSSASSTQGDVGNFLITTKNGDLVKMYYRNDRPPSRWTTFDDNTILFNSYDKTVDTTIQSAKTVVWGELGSTWTMADAFIPALNDKQFTLLENEAKQQAFVEAKQSSNPVASQRAHKGWVRARQTKTKAPYSMNTRVKTSTSGFGRNSAGNTIKGNTW